MFSNMTRSVKITLVTIASIVVIAVIAGFSIYGFFNKINNEGVKQETALVAQYKDNQNELSAYVLKFKESLGIADRQTDKLDEILEDAVKGRYDGNMEPGTSGSMFSAITEAYPDLTQTTKSYEKVQDLVVSGRDSFKNKQSKLLDMVSKYDSWRNTGLIRKGFIEDRFPSEVLTVTDNGKSYSADAALERIRNIVLTQDAVDSYETGTQDPLLLPEGDESDSE